MHPEWQERQRTTGASLIPLSLLSHLHIMSHLDKHTHTCIYTHKRWHKSKGKGHQMNLKMINADWDRHALALPPLHSQKWALWRPPPSFGRRWDCQIGLQATLLANREVEMEEGGNWGVGFGGGKIEHSEEEWWRWRDGGEWEMGHKV